ncbi:YcjX family protein [Candidatus Venteria ishoeyi]|uniref:YcjX family protein n=1 Tax=Candidatus Venteria ishoeyi TaxID=1899563 RepID=UPI0025A6300B|nr:YcjX family protein [Candidatus Venteria ishoeyi]MDM8545587.1 YcjX family protein [Candidatus Venteria ishoeyi]
MALQTFKKTIGIIGISGAGKTVFLTSLISQLKNHDPDKLQLDANNKKQKAEIYKFKEIREGINLDFFEHKKYFNTLIDSKKWPDKTTDTTYFRCQLKRSDWSWTDVDFTFLDFPGERFNDAIMLTDNNDFDAWSDKILERIESDPPCCRLAKEYFDCLQTELDKESKVFNNKKVLDTYKRTLARFMFNYGAFITPSVFALDTRGQQPVYHDDLNKVIEGRFLGCDAYRQFAPLPEKLRKKYPGIHNLYSQYYRQYCKQVVKPQFEQLAQCNNLLVLIDIHGLLVANTGRLNDTATIIGDVLRASVNEPEGMLSSLYKFFTFSFDKLEKIALIATKSDMVNYRQVDNLSALLYQLARPKLKHYPELKHQLFVCSAIKSTVMKNGNLWGHPVYSAEGSETETPLPDDLMSNLLPSDLPESWPGYWEPEQYFFPEIWPRVPYIKSMPPQHSGMENIINFIFNN